MSAVAAAERPAHSRVRRRVLGFAFFLTVITYLDRVCISTAAPFIMDELRLTPPEMGLVFSAFTLAYSLFEMPSGRMGDVAGPRRVLTRIVLWWSGFTMLTAAATSRTALLAIRFLFGAGEAGAFPNMARALSEWFPPRERGRANSVMFFGSRVGGMLSAPIAFFLIRAVGWRASFVGFGCFGLVWAAAWHAWFRDRPSEDPAVSLAELAAIEKGLEPRRPTRPVPWLAFATDRNLQTICAMYFTYAYGLYFYFSWLPTYLTTNLHLSTTGGWVFSGLPFFFAGLANLAGGWLTDALAARRGLRVARCWLGCASFLTAAAFVLAAAIVPQPIAKALFLAFALGSVDLSLGACWAVCLDVGADHAGVVTGAMNTFGNIGGLLTPIVAGFIVDKTGSWSLVLYVTAALYALGALAWLAVDPTAKLAPNP
jgi:ACS family glucarate transporter-like MFS transporter